MPQYDIAISFAGEDRKIAARLASRLVLQGLKVFYDEYVLAELWGKDLYVHLSKVYKDEAIYCLMLVSENYARKQWTNHERKAAQARAFQENTEYILPLRLDDTQINGILPTTGYLDYRTTSEDEIVNAAVEKVRSFHRKHNTAPDTDPDPDYCHSDTCELEKWLADLEEQKHRAEQEALHARRQCPELIGPFRAASNEASILATQIGHIQKIIERVNAGFPYLESFGFNVAVDACGEVSTWQDFKTVITSPPSSENCDPPIRVPIEAQKDYAAALATRLFDAFELCMCFEPAEEIDAIVPEKTIVHYLFGTIPSPHQEDSGRDIFLVSQW